MDMLWVTPGVKSVMTIIQLIKKHKRRNEIFLSIAYHKITELAVMTNSQGMQILVACRVPTQTSHWIDTKIYLYTSNIAYT